jgi:hypothetical protein
MPKQIIITQNNSGIGIYNTFLEPDKKTVKDITGRICSVDIVYPDGTSENLPVETIDSANGKVLFVLGDKQTSQAGLYKLYFNLSDSNSYITAQDMVTYYALAEKGGA